MPSWTIRCTYGEGALEKRAAALAAHEDYLRARSREIRFAGPMFTDDGETRTGLWLMIEAPERAAAERFVAGEAFNRAGMFAEIAIRRFSDASPAPPRQAGMVADPTRMMFVCEYVGGLATPAGAGAAPAEDSVAPARVIVRGEIVSDDAAHRVGTIAIVEVEDRAAAEAFLAADPEVMAGAYRRVRIDRWRFGKSVV